MEVFMFIDTHLHLSEKEGICPDQFIQNASQSGVDYLILSCCDKESIVEGLSFLEKYDCLFLSVGFHPEYAKDITDQDILWLKEVIEQNDRVVAIGEIGLDYHWDSTQKEVQKKLFRIQLSIAEEKSLPVVIHTRDAIQDTYDILREYSLSGVIHCYSGSVEMAARFIQLGYLLGIGGVVTFSNSKLYEVVKSVGLSHIVLETDSPYLAPVPYRGKINESQYIPVIAEKVAEILNTSLDEVAQTTTQNACSVFDLPLNL